MVSSRRQPEAVAEHRHRVALVAVVTSMPGRRVGVMGPFVVGRHDGVIMLAVVHLEGGAASDRMFVGAA